jgi:hypothetical protein
MAESGLIPSPPHGGGEGQGEVGLAMVRYKDAGSRTGCDTIHRVAPTSP